MKVKKLTHNGRVLKAPDSKLFKPSDMANIREYVISTHYYNMSAEEVYDIVHDVLSQRIGLLPDSILMDIYTTMYNEGRTADDMSGASNE
jgi:hypothetical protein